MIVNALITEYNPFHNGHIYHIEQSRALNPAHVTIAIMSGNFTQRGEIAITDKFTRAREVIKHVDLVVELPLYYATSYADDFGNGAIQIANMLNATHVVFGSESGNVDELKMIAEQLNSNQLNEEIQFHISQGKSYARAVSEALELQSEMSANNILGLAYIKAIHKRAPHITPLTIQRMGNQYNDDFLSSNRFSSATSLRKSIINGDIERARAFMPIELIKNIDNPLTNEVLFEVLKIIILNSSADELSNIYTIEEGIEHRLKSYIRNAHSYDEYINLVKTKRYTRTRLNRMMINILLNVTKEKFHAYRMPNAIRVLAMNNTGRNYLRTLKNEVNVVTNVNKQNSHYFTPEIMATDIYNTFSHSDENDFNTPVIIYD